MTSWDPDAQSALDEFAAEGQPPPRAWSRGSFAGDVNTLAAPQIREDKPFAPTREDTPFVWVVPVPASRGVSWWRWIAAAAGLAACTAIVAGIMLRPRVAPPTQSANSLPSHSVEVVSVDLPAVLVQATPAIPLPTFDRDVPVAVPSPLAVARPPAPAPTPAQPIVKEEIRPVETATAIPTPPVPTAPSAPSAAPAAPNASVRTEAVARTPEPAAPTLSVKEGSEREIRAVLDAYRDSYERRDVASTARLWPGVDKTSLSRAFSTLARQEIDFAECSLDVAGERAKARCIGSLQYVPRVGNSRPQTRPLFWDFELDHSSGHWLIDRMSAQ